MTRHNPPWDVERVLRLADLRRQREAEESADERAEDARDRLRQARVHRLTAGIWPLGEGDDFIHQLASNSVPVGEPPPVGTLADDGEPEPTPPRPARAPQGARDGPPERVSPDAWLKGALDAARLGSPRWTTIVSEPGSWLPA